MVKRYEPCHKWYAYDNEPTLEMQESAYGEYVKLETFQHEMARLQAQIDRMRKEGQRLHEVELTLKSQINGLESVNSELLEALEKISAIELQMYGPDWEEINIAKEIADAAIKKHGGNS